MNEKCLSTCLRDMLQENVEILDRNRWKLSGVMTGKFAAESVETLERSNQEGPWSLHEFLLE